MVEKRKRQSRAQVPDDAAPNKRSANGSMRQDLDRAAARTKDNNIDAATTVRGDDVVDTVKIKREKTTTRMTNATKKSDSKTITFGLEDPVNSAAPLTSDALRRHTLQMDAHKAKDAADLLAKQAQEAEALAKQQEQDAKAWAQYQAQQRAAEALALKQKRESQAWARQKAQELELAAKARQDKASRRDKAPRQDQGSRRSQTRRPSRTPHSAQTSGPVDPLLNKSFEKLSFKKIAASKSVAGDDFVVDDDKTVVNPDSFYDGKVKNPRGFDTPGYVPKAEPEPQSLYGYGSPVVSMADDGTTSGEKAAKQRDPQALKQAAEERDSQAMKQALKHQKEARHARKQTQRAQQQAAPAQKHAQKQAPPARQSTSRPAKQKVGAPKTALPASKPAAPARKSAMPGAWASMTTSAVAGEKYPLQPDRQGYGYSMSDPLFTESYSDLPDDVNDAEDTKTIEHIANTASFPSKRKGNMPTNSMFSFVAPEDASSNDKELDDDDALMVRVAPVTSFYVARPERRLSCTKAKRDDTVLIKAAVKNLFIFDESEDIYGALVQRLERMVKAAANRDGELPIATGCARQIRDAVVASAKARIETGEVAKLVKHECDWAKWMLKACKTGVMHTKTEDCTCMPYWERDEDEEAGEFEGFAD